MVESKGRPGFIEWLEKISKVAKVGWSGLPLTHVTKALLAEDIIRAGVIKPQHCDVFKRPLSYFFYGRPAFRVKGDGPIKIESACPVCFVFQPNLIDKAANLFPFDTGAFQARMYKSSVMEEMKVEDFQFQAKDNQPGALLETAFSSPLDYMQGKAKEAGHFQAVVEKWEFHAQAYVELIVSKGRNEADDRVYSVEIQVEEEVLLKGNLIAVVVPHTLWIDNAGAPWIEKLVSDAVEILTYNFDPGRGPDYYHYAIEQSVKDFYFSKGFLK